MVPTRFVAHLNFVPRPRRHLLLHGLTVCSVCGILLAESPCGIAAENAPKKNQPVAKRSVEKRTTPAPQVAPLTTKTQLAKTRNSPLQTLKAATSVPAARVTDPNSSASAAQTPRVAVATMPPTQERSLETAPESAMESAIEALENAPESTAAPQATVPETAAPETTTPETAAPETDASPATESLAPADMTDAATTNAAAATENSVEEPAQESTPVATEASTGESIENSATDEPLTGTIQLPSATPGATSETGAAESTPATPGDSAPGDSAPGTAAPTAQTPTGSEASRLYAPSISYEGGVIIAEGTPENPVRLESADARIIAQKVRLDTIGKTVSAEGTVRVERQVTVKRYSAFQTKGTDDPQDETITETLQGENFEYNYGTRQGRLGATKVRLANFNISAESLTINGQKYIARNVVVRPGGLSEEELKIYGTPPFNLRAREFIVDASKPAVSNANRADTAQDESAGEGFSARTRAKGAALYFKNTRLFPVPSALLSRQLGRREQATYQITPRVYFNSADGLLVTTKLYFPFSQANPERLTFTADVGLSTKVGFRGGVELESHNRLGIFSLGARVNDVIVSQLTNRIELDRLPEFSYRPPSLRIFNLPGGRSAGFKFGLIAGNYREQFTDRTRNIESSRLQGQVRFTTRLAREDGPYLDLFARTAKYSDHFENLRTLGFEVGYTGQITNRIAGQFSYSATSVSGSTPFQFDEVEIKKELRATFDVLLTPRYIVPIDLRYDLDRNELRDKSFGLLRNYKTFAYGVTYQSSRSELRFEVRQGF